MNNGIILGFLILGMAEGLSAQSKSAQMVTTTENKAWVQTGEISPSTPASTADVVIDVSKTRQTMRGFGTCFNELGWTSLSLLKPEDRDAVMKELFAPGAGANFSICRMPVGANDFSLNWYSYNETDGDFEMANFSVENDRNTLIPFILNATQYNPELEIWASPWSPPSWMKYNKHYASRSSAAIMATIEKQMQHQQTGTDNAQPEVSGHIKRLMDSRYQNDLPADREGREGTDMFIQEDKYLKAYALYFSKFVEAYRKEGIRITSVMPQNEFNSAQNFPSCCWTSKGLASFIGSYLGPAMEKQGVHVLFGTMERPSEALVDTILNDPLCREYVKGVGFQWAGRDALPGIYKRYPNLELYQSEQECGDGTNDWKGVLHSWDLMKHYLNNGVSVYEYWNTSLLKEGISRWGWAQNSLVVVDPDTRTYRFSNEYYLLKHLSHYVMPGARKLETGGSYMDVLAFLNPDQSVVLMIANPEPSEKTVHLSVSRTSYAPVLQPLSFSTLIIGQ